MNRLLAKNRSITTVGIYLRPLRAIINQAIEEGEFSREVYPFGKRRYQIPSSRNIKKALTLDEIGRIARFQAIPGTWWERARDMFMFSYFANGINMKDILKLKYANIDGEYVRFVRAKTHRTNRSNSTSISFHLSKELNDIINRLGNKNIQADNYIFPVLTDGITPEKEMADVQQFIQMINTYLKKIAEQVGIEKKVTTYFARHSFATVLKKSGMSPLFISESLGHTSLKTTEIYLDSFEDETKKQVSEFLRKF
jgi:integrase/recombinase XerD